MYIKKTLTFDDLLKLPPISKQEINGVLNFKPLKELKPNVYKALFHLVND